MMTNLFSTFDPITSNYFSMNWMSIFLCLIMFNIYFWLIPSRPQILLINIVNYICKEVSNNINNHNKKLLIVFFTVFWVILINNLMGLYPYVFTATSHMSITLSMALPTWITLMLYGWINMTNSMFSHLVPNGTPMALSSFMVLIETTSNIIRPMTLAVRLSANMIAGHLLISLLSGISEQIPSLYLTTFPVLITLMILEYAVAMIQSYVFITLMSLYLSEIN